MGNFKKHIHPLLRREKRQDIYDDSNYAVLNALDTALNETEQETIKSKIQSSLETATGEFLDRWGDWFGVYRDGDEDDEHYREHIIRHTLLPRGTIQSIIDAIKWFLKDSEAHIEIYEPWKNIFYTNGSKLNGEDKLMGHYYRFAIIDISIDRPFPPEIMDIIWAFKPAGVLFYVGYDSGNDITARWVESAHTDIRVTNLSEIDRLTGCGVSIKGDVKATDVKTLSDPEDIFHTNRSKLNGTDVLAGAFDHSRDHLHLYGTSKDRLLVDMTTTLAKIKTSIKESDNTGYVRVSEGDSVSDRVNANDKQVYLVFNIKAFIIEYLKEEYTKYIGKSPEVVNNKDYSSFMKNPTISIIVSALASPNEPVKATLNLKDFRGDKWFSVWRGDIGTKTITENISLGTLADSTNSEGLIVAELAFENKGDIPVDIDYWSLTFANNIPSGYDITNALAVSNDTIIETK